MKQKINIRLSLIALIAIITTAVGITMVYYSLFQGQVRNDLKQNAVLLVETDLFQNAYTSGKESSENLEHLISGNLRIIQILPAFQIIWIVLKFKEHLKMVKEKVPGVPIL